MGLATYLSCSFKEKRVVLRTFWSARPHDSEKINQAAREYGIYALWLIVVVTVELSLISVLLIVRSGAWSWVTSAASVLAIWSVGWTLKCRSTFAAPRVSQAPGK